MWMHAFICSHAEGQIFTQKDFGVKRFIKAASTLQIISMKRKEISTNIELSLWMILL